MEAEQEPGRPANAGSRDPGGTPVLPMKSRDESDIGWGGRDEPDEDDRLLRDRPPHWDSV